MARVSVEVRLDRRAIEALWRDPASPWGIAAQEIARETLTEARRRAGRHRGELRRRLDMWQRRSGDAVEFDVGTRRWPPAIPHHQGARPHVIEPRRGRTLSFVVGGRRIFVRRVRHPGHAANPYLDDALEQALRDGGFTRPPPP